MRRKRSIDRTRRPQPAVARWKPSERGVVAAMVLIASLPVLGGTMLAVALPDIAQNLHVRAGSAVSVVTVYLVVLSAMQPVAGVIGDRFGWKCTTRLGLGLVAVGSLLAMLSWSLGVLALARAIQALGVSLTLPGVHAQLIRGHGDDGQRFGVLIAVGNLAAAVGPLIGGLLVLHFGWREIFLATGVLAGAATLAVLRLPASQPVDSRRPSQVPLKEVVADHRTLAMAGLNGVDNLLMSSLVLGMPFLLVDRGGMAAAAALATLAMAGAVAAPVGGRLADRLGHVVAVRLGFSVAAVGLIALCGSRTSLGDGSALLTVALIGVGLGIEIPSLQAAPLQMVPMDRRGSMAGFMASARQVGSAVGAVLVTALASIGPAAVFGIAALLATLAPTLAGVFDPAPRSRRTPSAVRASHDLVQLADHRRCCTPVARDGKRVEVDDTGSGLIHCSKPGVVLVTAISLGQRVARCRDLI